MSEHCLKTLKDQKDLICEGKRKRKNQELLLTAKIPKIKTEEKHYEKEASMID